MVFASVAQSPVVHTLQGHAATIAPGIEQADEPVIIAVGKAAALAAR
jgi:hypothetical protein